MATILPSVIFDYPTLGGENETNHPKLIFGSSHLTSHTETIK